MSGGTQNSLRKALGAIKDTTTVSLAKVNSDYKVLFLLGILVIFRAIVNGIFKRVFVFVGVGYCNC